MLSKEIKDLLASSKTRGWVLEPDAKKIFSLLGVSTPQSLWAKNEEEAIRFARKIGYPLVAKVVSPSVIHKSERSGVVLGIRNDQDLVERFRALQKIEGAEGIVVEEMVSGLELIVGGKIDYQFGPVILLGIGGTGVEIYRDVTLRMAPLSERDVESMIVCLRAHQLLEGYRGRPPIHLGELRRLLTIFSSAIVELKEEVESIDLNPVICSPERCVVADARIMLRANKTS
jgi:acetate---CoA ligase (ADP-forming) subunit beta